MKEFMDHQIRCWYELHIHWISNDMNCTVKTGEWNFCRQSVQEQMGFNVSVPTYSKLKSLKFLSKLSHRQIKSKFMCSLWHHHFSPSFPVCLRWVLHSWFGHCWLGRTKVCSLFTTKSKPVIKKEDTCVFALGQSKNMFIVAFAIT